MTYADPYAYGQTPEDLEREFNEECNDADDRMDAIFFCPETIDKPISLLNNNELLTLTPNKDDNNDE